MANRRSFIKNAALAVPGLAVLGESALTAPPTSLTLPTWGSVPANDYWDEVRARYALSDHRAYMNTGGLGPCPRPVLDRYLELTNELQTVSETGHRYIEEAREPVASFFGANASEISFTRNATEGNATIASGLGLNAGHEIVIDSHAHPGGAIPWLNQLKANGIVVRLFDPDAPTAAGILERIEEAITPRTRVVQISHVTAPTGILLPAKAIADLAHSHGCWFHIDGAQSAGMLPIDLHQIGCDSWATSGHKWLGAPHGTGILYIRRDRLNEVLPTEIGAYSDAGYSLPDHLDYIDTSRRHESGTRNAPLVEGVQNACTFISEIGIARVRERGLELTSALRAGLESIPSVQVLTPEDEAIRGSILTFKSSKMSYSDLNKALSTEHKLRLRVVTEVNLNAIRVSLHVFNSMHEVERVIEGVRSVLDV